MATQIEELLIKLEADTKDFQAEMRAAVSTVKGSADKMEKDIESLSKSGGGSGGMGGLQASFAAFSGFLASQAVLGAISAVKDAFGALWGVVADGIEAANMEEQAVVRLATALQSTGQFTKDATNEFVAFAGALEETTGFADDAVISAGALISTISGLAGGDLQKATSLTADLAARLGIDLESAARLVGKAMDGNVEALGKYGISIQEGADKTETMKNVMDGLQASVGGTADKLGQTFSGSVARAGNAFGNFGEELGKLIKDNPVVIALINQAAEVFTRWTSSIAANKTELIDLVSNGIEIAVDVSRKLLFVVDTLFRTFTIGPTLMKQLGDAAIDTFAAIAQAADGDFSGAIETIKGTVKEGVTDFKEHLFGANILTEIDAQLAEAQSRINASFGTTRETLDGFNESQNNTKVVMAEVTEEMKKQAEEGVKLAETLVAAAQLGGDEETAVLNEKFIQQQEALEAALEQKKITQETYAIAEAELLRKSNEEAAKLDAKRTEDARKQSEGRLNDLKSTFGFISSLSSSKNKELAAIGKAAAIGQATIDTYAAANKALSSAPPPFNFALAAAVTAAGLANVAKIVGLQQGIDEVPGIGSRDSFPAVLAPGERVVPRETNKDLTAFLEQKSPNQAPTQVVVNLNFAGDFFESEENNIKLLERIQKGIDTTGFRLRTST